MNNKYIRGLNNIIWGYQDKFHTIIDKFIKQVYLEINNNSICFNIFNVFLKNYHTKIIILF